jgi:hypothetical protein
VTAKIESQRLKAAWHDGEGKRHSSAAKNIIVKPESGGLAAAMATWQSMADNLSAGQRRLDIGIG